MRQVLNIPANPGGQRTVLVVLVHSGQMPPLFVAAEQLHQPGFESRCETTPTAAETSWLVTAAGLRSILGASRRGQRTAPETLPPATCHRIDIRRKSCAALTNERKQTRQIISMARGRTLQVTSSEAARPVPTADRHHGVRAAAQPEHRRSKPVARTRPQRSCDRRQIAVCREEYRPAQSNRGFETAEKQRLSQ